MTEQGEPLPQGMFNGLEVALKSTKTQVDDIEFRLDEMGVTCGSASTAFAYK